MSGTPFMQFYVADYLADTRHLTTEQHGAYLLLLMTMWKAGGSLPNDPRKLARIAGIHPPRWAKVWSDLAEFFTVSGGEITQGRLVKEYEKAVHKSQLRAVAGSKGGTAKALKNNEPDIANATAKLKHSSESESDIEKEATSVASQKCALSFSDFWASWPNKTAKAQAEKAWKKLGPADREAAAASAVAWFSDWRRKHPDASPIHPASYLNQRRWEDEGPKQPVQASRFDAAASNIRSGKPYLCGNISATLARELISQGLVTEAQCREARVI